MNEVRVRLRPEIAAVAPYRQGRPAAPDAFKLSSNENPFPPLPAVVDAIAQAATTINRYPDSSAAGLRARLAERFGVTERQVHIGPGSVSVLAELVTAAAAPGDEIVFAWRSFEMYPLLAATSGATPVAVPNTADHRHDLDAMAAAITDRTRVVIVCSPNNPTGTAIDEAEFEAFMARVPREVLVILDEAYIEFVTDASIADGRALLPRHPNLVLARTFSKAWGLAGLRIGYAIGPEYVLDAARAVAVPLAITDAAQRAALVSLDHEAELLHQVGVLTERRDRIRDALLAQGWQVPVSHANFLWLPIGPKADEAAEVFARHGIVARALGDGVRVSIGEEEAVAGILASAAEIVGKPPTSP